jgi:thymidine kinase
VRITASALDMDWQGRPFPMTAALAAMADEVVKLRAHCSVCGRPATKTLKRSAEGGLVDLGGADKYEPRCNVHWHAP